MQQRRSVSGSDSAGRIFADRGRNTVTVAIIKALPLLLAMSVIASAINCASVDSRVKKNQMAFDSWPADVREKVRAGKIEIGFTNQMVHVALGDPDRIITRTTDRGVSEGWVYEDSSPGFSLGLGLGAMHGINAFGGGVSVGDGWRDRELLRVIIEDGKVTAIETRK